MYVCVSVLVSVYLSVSWWASFHVCLHFSACLFAYKSGFLSTAWLYLFLPPCLLACLAASMPLCLSVCLSICLHARAYLFIFTLPFSLFHTHHHTYLFKRPKTETFSIEPIALIVFCLPFPHNHTHQVTADIAETIQSEDTTNIISAPWNLRRTSLYDNENKACRDKQILAWRPTGVSGLIRKCL